MKIFILLSLLLPILTFAQAQKLKVIGVSIESVFDKGKGLEERILNKLFNCMQVEYDYVIVPFGRHTNLFNSNDDYDAVATVAANIDLKGHRTQSHIKYYNGITTLKEKNLDIRSFADLKGLSVISFIGAKDVFPELKKIIPTMKAYKEVADQKSHSLLLFNERVDAIFSDGYIVSKYHALIREEHKEKIYHKAVNFNLISDPTKFHVYFKSEKLRDKFNQCLEQKSISKTIDAFINEYRIKQMITP